MSRSLILSSSSGGESGSGKSVLLLQTVSLAYAADWIVIYAPRGEPNVEDSPVRDR
jgi:predicted ATP-dependent serine protease